MSATVTSVSKKMDLLEKKLALLNEELELVKTELPIESIIASLRSASPAELSQISSLLSLSASASAPASASAVAVAVKKGRGKKAKADQLAAADAADSSSTTSSQKRKVGEKTQLHNTQTSVVAALVKANLAGKKEIEGRKIPAGFHLKIGSILKTEMALSADASPSEEQVEEAISFWIENPDWMSPNERKKAEGGEKKSAEVESTPKKAKKAAEPKSLLASASASESESVSVAEVPKPAKKPSVLAAKKEKEKKEEKKEEYTLVEGETMENLENIRSVDPLAERKQTADGAYYYVSPESNEAFTLELDPAGEYNPKTNTVSAASEAESEDDE
jgi:hypothetical protein